MRLRSVFLFGFALVVADSMACGALSQPLPQWLPVETLDKPFNDAAGDLKKPQRFVLRDCGNERDHFICTYRTASGIGIAAWAPQAAGLVEQITIAIPPCRAVEDLSDLSTMLIYILHPRRPLATFPRAIVAMNRYASVRGSGVYWLDGVSYLLIDRGPLGLGLVVHRTPHDATPLTEEQRARLANAQRFYLPPSDCPIEPPAVPADPGISSRY
jgi:hypothetical protein